MKVSYHISRTSIVRTKDLLQIDLVRNLGFFGIELNP